MEIFLIKKFKNAFLAIMIMGVLSAVLIIAMLATIVLNSGLKSQIDVQEKQLAVYKKKIKGDPEHLIGIKQSVKNSLTDQKQQLSAIFNVNKGQGVNSSNPLAFKQLLFDVQEKLQKKAVEKRMSLPSWFGFEEFKLKVPDNDITETLVNELVIVEQLVEFAINSGIESIDNIKLSHKAADVLIAEQKFKYLPISLSVRTGSAQIKDFLMDIAEMKHMVTIKKINIKKADNDQNLLSAQIILDLIEI
jgi:hypothetical protein